MSKLHPQDNKCIGSAAQATEISKYVELFDETPVFHSIQPRTKAGFGGWNNPDRLKTAREMGFLLSRKRNIAIRLGIDTERGYTVVFDKESYGDIPDNLLQSISELALISWQSQSGGSNHLLTVTQDAYQHLDQFKQKVTFQGDKHDLELLTSGYALVPPSKIDDNHQYDDLETNAQAPTVEIDSIREILNDIPIEKKSEGSGSGKGHNQKEREEIDTLPDSFDIESYCEDNLPGTDSFRDRLRHVIHDNDKLKQLWFAQPEDRSRNEIELSRELAWRFNADRKIVQHIFEEELPIFRTEQLKYHENETHAKDVLNFEEYVSRPYYINALSFNFREQVAEYFLENEDVEANELYDQIYNIKTKDLYHEDSIKKGLGIMMELELIERISHGVYKNKDINTEYVEELTRLNNDESYKPIKESYEK
ncbi:hypothetical protein [Halorubrum sp. Atlit-26R]|uniref:hypothetical protein n=1 Tax=Halorubrum sp. Atlit-26R TaxID=2282128 RepID=UPI0011C3F0D1|nr:hypothetical protein [Halorubrum sp. Atlit-26R]